MPVCIAEKLGRPRSSSAQTSPSSTASSRVARSIAVATSAKALRQVVVGTRPELAAAAADVRKRAVAVELHLVEPVPAARELVDERREHRPVARAQGSRRRRPRRASAGSASSAPCRRGAPGTSVQTPWSRSPPRRTVRPPSRFSSSSSYVPWSQISTVPGAVLAGRDLARERRVLERVVLDVHRERLGAALERNALRDGPRREHAVALEPEVVVEAARGVLLDDEDRRAVIRRGAAERLRRPGRVALASCRRRALP